MRDANGPEAKMEAMISKAEESIGLGEPNHIQDWYEDHWGDLGGNWPWCNAAVTYWAHMSGNAVAVCFGEDAGFAYTVAHAQAFKDRGRWTYGTAGIRRGDIVFFDWQGQDSISAIDHVELVTGVDPDGTVHTIGGNYQNRCDRWERHAYEIAGYGRPAYGGATEPEPDDEEVPSVPEIVKLAAAQRHDAGATRVIQDALNEEYGGVAVDGDYGPQTKAAYTRWQQSLGWPGDGEPGAHSLWSLAKKHGFKTDITGTPAGPQGAPAPDPDPEATYTVKAGDTLSSIASALDVEGGWAALYAANKSLIGPDPDALAVGLVLAVPDGDAEPEEPPTTPPPASRKVTFEAVYYGAPVNESVKIVQDALNKEFGGVTVDGDYGDQTREAYSKWQRKLGYTGSVSQPGSGADGNPGMTSLSRLAAKYGFEIVRGTAPTPDTPTDGEPAHVYTRVTYGGKTVNARTRAMLQNAAKLLTEYEWTPRLTQGSYNVGVGASAGTHDGGGVVDINVSSMSVNGMYICAQALRKAGMAAWVRTPAQGFAYHIHAVAIGDREMSPAAKSQIAQWRDDTNGLANHGPDPYADPYPAWTQKYR